MTEFFELFKFGTLISFPLFALTAFLFVRKVAQFSLFNYTFSQTIFFLERPVSILIFRLNFLIKSLLDLSFALYVFNRFSVPIFSFPALVILLGAIFFGLLALFTENKDKSLHYITVYSSGVMWAIGEIYLAYLTQSRDFINFTYLITASPLILAFVFLAAKKTNAIVQIVCYVIMYVWHIVFVINYL